MAVVAVAFGASAATLDLLPSLGSGGWGDRAYDATTHTITYTGSWVGCGWWYGDNPGVDYSEYDQFVLETEETTIGYSIVIQYNGGVDNTSVSVPAGRTGATVDLNAAGKSDVQQIYIQNHAEGTITVKAAYLQNEKVVDPAEPVVLVDKDQVLSGWNSFKIESVDYAAAKVVAGDQLVFEFNSEGGSFKVCNPASGWPVMPFMEKAEGYSADYGTIYLPEDKHSFTFTLEQEDVDICLASGTIVQGDKVTVTKVYILHKEGQPAEPELSNWYISGNFQGWSHAAEGYAFAKTATEGVFEFKTAEISGEFLIVWADTPGTPDWNKKLGGVSNMVADKAYTYVEGGNNFSVSGIIKDATITLDTNAKTIAIKGADAENEYTDIYLVGDFGEGWSESLTTMPLTLKSGDTYEGTYTLIAEKSYFKLKAGNFVYGTGGEDVAVELGTEYTTAKTGNAYSIPAGEYVFTYVMAKNAENGKLTVKKATGIADIAADENAPVEYFNLQGMRISQPAAGEIVIRRQGSKVSKVLVK